MQQSLSWRQRSKPLFLGEACPAPIFLHSQAFWGFFAKTPEEPAPPVLPGAQICGHMAIHAAKAQTGTFHLCNQVKYKAQREQAYHKF